MTEPLHYPTRPLKLTKRSSPLVRLIVVGLLCLPAIIAGGVAARDALHTQSMRSRAVEATVLSGESQCTRTRRAGRSWRTVGCDVQVSYRVRPEHGGAVYSGKTRVLGKPLFMPRIFYDPKNPTSIIEQQVLQRGVHASDFLSSALLLLLPGLAIVGMSLSGQAGFAKAALAPRWEKVRVTQARRLGPTNQLELLLQADSGKTVRSVLPQGVEPLVASPPPNASGDSQWILALIDMSGRPHPLDRDLQLLDLTAEERAAVLRLALS